MRHGRGYIKAVRQIAIIIRNDKKKRILWERFFECTKELFLHKTDSKLDEWRDELL